MLNDCITVHHRQGLIEAGLFKIPDDAVVDLLFVAQGVTYDVDYDRENRVLNNYIKDGYSTFVSYLDNHRRYSFFYSNITKTWQEL